MCLYDCDTTVTRRADWAWNRRVCVRHLCVGVGCGTDVCRSCGRRGWSFIGTGRRVCGKGVSEVLVCYWSWLVR